MNDHGGSTAPLTRRLQILLALARSDLHIRYGRGRGQLIQWIVDPFALVGVYLLLRVMFGAGGTAPGLSLACAVVPFQIILFSCVSAMSAVSLREPILMNMAFDRMLIPPSSVVTESLAFAASFIMFPIAMIIYGVGPQLSLLWLPVIVAVALILAMGAAWPAALLGLWFPAVRTLTAQGLRLLFFAAPGIVALSEVSHDVKRWIVYNPFTGLFEAFRHVFVYGDSPPLWQLAYPAGVGLALALVFIPLYRREERHFAKLVGDN